MIDGFTDTDSENWHAQATSSVTAPTIPNAGCSIPAAAPEANIRAMGARCPVVVSGQPHSGIAPAGRRSRPQAALALTMGTYAAPWVGGQGRNTGVAVVAGNRYPAWFLLLPLPHQQAREEEPNEPDSRVGRPEDCRGL
jgi:hypothetical protein